MDSSLGSSVTYSRVFPSLIFGVGAEIGAGVASVGAVFGIADAVNPTSGLGAVAATGCSTACWIGRHA